MRSRTPTRSPIRQGYTSAQLRTLIGVSARTGTASERIAVNTWNNTGEFYIQVRGRNGVFSRTAPFALQVTMLTGVCGHVNAVLPPGTLAATPGGYRTLILHDLSRMAGTAADKTLLQARLSALATRAEVQGSVIDISRDGRVAAARIQADRNPGCPYAQNLLASSIKEIVARSRAANPLEYVVLVGNDDVIPFFRYPDPAPIGRESDYVPPVLDTTASGASLRLDYVLGQDGYGATTEIALQGSTLPIPDLAVGRLVETAGEAVTVIDAYLSTAAGIVTPTTAFISSYGFLEDGANAVRTELSAGLGAPNAVTALIDPASPPPNDPLSWSANDLRARLAHESPGSGLPGWSLQRIRCAGRRLPPGSWPARLPSRR